MKFPANELWGNKNPKCPYCHKENSLDMDSPNTDNNYFTELECTSCHKKFIVKSFTTLLHSTVGDCIANGQMPHELVARINFPDGDKVYRCKKCQGEVYSWELPGGKFAHFIQDDFVIVSEK